MTQAKLGDAVKFHFTGTFQDGDQFDTSHGNDPLEVTLGEGNIMPAVEQALVGMAAGDSKKVDVAADQAYGPRRPELVVEVERSNLPPELQLEVGGVLQATGQQGEVIHLTVVSMTETMVTLDQNHPLAGKDLTFDLELVEIG